MDVFSIILLVMSIPSWAVCILLFTFRMNSVLDKKGYHYPHVVFWLIPGGMITVTTLLLVLAVMTVDGQLLLKSTTLFTHLLVFYAPLLISVGLFAPIACLVPRRRRRGPRKVPSVYHGASLLFYAASITSPVLLLVVFHVSFLNSLRLISPLWIMAASCSYLAYRAAVPGLDETVRTDTRPAVLYLRPFQDEGRIFARLPRRARDILGQYFNRYAPSPNKLYQTFEEFFTESIRSKLGPFVALGNPQDTLPPLGARRAYFSDQTWQKEVEQLATSALCILAPVSQSKNLKWELDYLRKSGLLTKLFILTPPATAKPLTSPLARLADFFIRLLTVQSLEKWNVRETASWEDFRVLLIKLGYTLPVTDPGPGSVVTFDMMGNAIPLVQGAGTAEEYVKAIATRLSQARESHM